MGQQSFIDSIGPVQILYVLAIVGIALLLRYGPSLLAWVARSISPPHAKVTALELAAVPANRRAAAFAAFPLFRARLKPRPACGGTDIATTSPPASGAGST